MTETKANNNLAELLRRSARTGFATNSPLILDRKRISRLAAERRQKISESIADAASNGSETSDTRETTMPARNMSTKSSDLFTETTGIVIGDTQQATYASLDKFNRDICECQKCPLGKTRLNFVFGVGNPNADLMFIGEAPGRNEDEQGEPFVGRAGQLLDKILAAINLKREDIYIANILKCRPPGNRDPQPEEMAECFPYLKEQIALIQPKIICALGRIAAQALLDTKTPLGKLRGQWHSYQGIPLRVTYHPAALLRNPAFKRVCWEDIQIVQAEFARLAG